ncbi:MAG: CAP domain-containing protein [Pseudonocardia sp.]
MHTHTVSSGPFTRWEDVTRRAARAFLLAAAAASLLVAGVAQAAPPLPLPPLPPLLPGGSAPQPPPTGEPAPEPRGSRPTPPVATSDWPAQIVSLTNDEREAAGCDPVYVDHRLRAAAQRHAEDMADRGEMSHLGGDGSTFDERIRAEGHPQPGAENVARGYPDAATTVREWMASPGHRANILNCLYVTTGVGFDPRGNFVAQEFGHRE